MEEKISRIDFGFVNAYLLQTADSFVLVDTGVGKDWQKFESELLRRGALPEHLKLVILTHGDLDHSGNCKHLQEKYGLKIAVHEGDYELVTKGDFGKRSASSLLGRFINLLGNKTNSPADLFEPDLFLTDGQRLDEFGLPAVVIHTPGHTIGSISILTDDGGLLVGDTLGNFVKPVTGGLFVSKTDLQNSLSKLRNCKAETIYPGHGKPFAFREFPED